MSDEPKTFPHKHVWKSINKDVLEYKETIIHPIPMSAFMKNTTYIPHRNVAETMECTVCGKLELLQYKL